jgi:hypothetical protein
MHRVRVVCNSKLVDLLLVPCINSSHKVEFGLLIHERGYIQLKSIFGLGA